MATRSERFADLLNIDHPASDGHAGVLNPDEPDSVRLIREITAALAGKGGKKARSSVSPYRPPRSGAEQNLTYHEATIRQVVTELGYES